MSLAPIAGVWAGLHLGFALTYTCTVLGGLVLCLLPLAGRLWALEGRAARG